MQEQLEMNGMRYVVETGLSIPMTAEQKAQAMDDVMRRYPQGSILAPQKAGCASCGPAPGGMIRLGTANCGGPYVQNTTKTLTATVIAGTLPITFTWTITKPDTTTETKNGQTAAYTFAQVGTYKISLAATNACGTDTTPCDVTITAPCVVPSCDVTLT